jgi:cell division protease FtsH
MPDYTDFKNAISKKMKDSQWSTAVIFLLTIFMLFLWNSFRDFEAPWVYTIKYSQFLVQLNNNNIDSVHINNLAVKGALREQASIFLTDAKEPVLVQNFQTNLPSFQGEELLAKLVEQGVTIDIAPKEELSPFWQFIVGLLPWLVIIGVWVFIMRRAQRIQGGPGGLFSFGKSKARLHDVQKPTVTFKDVAGMENTKKDLQETIEFLKDPTKFKKLAAGHRQDTAGPGSGRRSRGFFLQHQRLGIYRDVRRGRRLAGTRHVSTGKEIPAEYHFHR